MMSRRQRALLLAVLTMMSTVSLIDAADAQGEGVHVSSDLELLGVGGLSGGGHLTWTLTGAPARLLRQKVLWMYDGYANVPRGFAYAGNVTPADADGAIDSGEAEKYTDFLQNEVEGIRYGYSGTETRYVRIDRTDILEEGFPVERSTEGLVQTAVNSSERLEIRFIFNADTISENLRFRFSDIELAQALQRVFDLRQVQANSTDPWPLVREGGWHTVQMADGAWALWHGNDATWTGDPFLGRYDNASANVTRTTTEFGVPYTDLRFATSANVTFRYTGSAADVGDTLRLQIAQDASYSVWTDLTSGAGDTDLPDAPSWRAVSYDLTPYVGRTVRLRLNFTSDATGNAAPGFFVRDFTINGPSRYIGGIESSSTDYLVGTLSFQEFDMRTGRAHLIRTPAGEILMYSGSYSSAAPPEDTMRLKGFDAVENPQILFVVLVVTAYLTSWFQDKLYSRYRNKLPERDRSEAKRLPWVLWIGRLLIFLFILFYFVPSFFVLFGASNAIVSGGAFWAFSIGSTATFTVLLWYLYERKAKTASGRESEESAPATEALEPAPPTEMEGVDVPPPPPEPGEGLVPIRITACARCRNDVVRAEDMYGCPCGQVYHRTCAAELGTCPTCGRTLEVAAPAQRRMMTAKCPTCGEIQVVPEGSDLLQTRCEACGALLQEVERGYNYLVISPDSDLALEWFHSIVKRSVPGMALSTTFADKLRKEFGLEGVDLYWLTDTDSGPKSIDPKRLDFELMRAVSNFIKQTKGGALFMDGLEYLVVENSFDRVLKFIKKVTDLASVHEVTLIIPVTAGSIGSDEMTLLRKEFDRVVETSGRAGAAPPRP